MTTANRFLLGRCTLSLALLLVGCGSSNSKTETTYSVSGTVLSTLIEAFCKGGGYYSVNSTDDGTEKHPFSMTRSESVNCNFIMTTNEKDLDITKHIITPILLNDGATTSSYFQLSNDTDIGYIELPMSGCRYTNTSYHKYLG